jgi:WD40 repeat protein
MSPLRTGMLVLAFLAAPLLLPAEKEARPVPRPDLHGDPLPADALMRLGTVRLRHGIHVSAVAFARAKKLLASTSNDGTIRLWDTTTGKEQQRVTIPPNPTALLPTLALSADGKKLAWPEGKKVHLWIVAAGKELSTWENQDEDMFLFLAFAPDGKTLAVINDAAKLSLREVEGGKEVRVFKTFRAPRGVAFSADGRLLAGGDGAVIRVWETATAKQVHRLVRHREQVTSIAFSPDGKMLASAGDDNAVRLWDLASEKTVRQMDHPNTRPATAHFVIENNIFTSTGVAFTPDGRNLISTVKGDRFLRQWDVATGKELRKFEGHQDGSLCMALSPDGATLAAGAEDSCVRLWDVAGGKELFPAEAHRGRIFNVSLAGKTAATAGRDNVVRIWDIATGRQLRAFGKGEDRMGFVVFSPDGRVMAMGRSDDEIIQLWDLTTARLLRELELPQSGVTSLAFTSDSKIVAVLGDESTVYQWEVATGKKVHEWKSIPPKEEVARYYGGMKSLAFSPDGKLLATAEGGRPIQLWDAATGKHQREFTPDQQRRNATLRVLFSPDGRTLAMVARDNSVTLWSVATGQKLHQLTKLGVMHPQGMYNLESAVYSPDGKLIAAAGADSKVLLFEVATGALIRELQTDQGWVSALAFGPDGKTLIVGGLNTTVLLCDVTGIRSGTLTQPKELMAKDLDARWSELLLLERTPSAYEALWGLVAAPGQAVPFLRERVRPVMPLDPQRLNKLLTDLDSNQFAARKKAIQELEAAGELAEEALRKLLAGKPALDLQKRVEAILEKSTVPQLTGEKLRMLRAIAVLEHIGTPEANKVLQELAKGVPAARQTQEAKAALGRMERQMAGR